MTNFGFIGLGGRGQSMLRELISVDGVKVTAVCDKYDDRANLGAEIVKEKTGEDAQVYRDYKELLARDDIKGVVVCTTRLAAPQALRNAGSWSERVKKQALTVCSLKTAVMTTTKCQFSI